MSPQQFVDQLNRSEMPKLGYELVTDENGVEWWAWPVYDHSQSSPADFKGKDPIAAQRKRGIAPMYSDRYPVNH